MPTSNVKAYRAYHDAKQRCNNPNHPRYKDWGGRGITMKFSTFEDFLSEVGLPKEGESIDRKDNDKSYEAGNVRWVSRSAQQHNKRDYSRNKTGMSGVREVSAKGLKTKTYQAFVHINGKFKQLYTGPSFDSACEARLKFKNETQI